MSRDSKSSYYDAGGIEVFDILRAKLTHEQFKGFLLGNALKYTCRLNHKGTAERDAEKAANYMKWLFEEIMKAKEDTGCLPVVSEAFINAVKERLVSIQSGWNENPNENVKIGVNLAGKSDEITAIMYWNKYPSAGIYREECAFMHFVLDACFKPTNDGELYDFYTYLRDANPREMEEYLFLRRDGMADKRENVVDRVLFTMLWEEAQRDKV